MLAVAEAASSRFASDRPASTTLLTGLSAGRDYALGFAVPQGGSLPRATVVSGVDTASARATEDLFRALGRGTLRIAPVEAAEFVAHLRDALGRRAPALACTSVRR